MNVLRWPWSTRPPSSPSAAQGGIPDPAALHTCPQCRHTAGLLDEHWLSVTRSASGAPVVQVCTPLCATLWLEATYRAGVPL